MLRECKTYVMQGTACQDRTMFGCKRVVVSGRLHRNTVDSGPSGLIAAVILIRRVGRFGSSSENLVISLSEATTSHSAYIE